MEVQIINNINNIHLKYSCVSVIFKGLPVEVLGARLLLLPEVDRLVQYYSIASILCECLALGLHVCH